MADTSIKEGDQVSWQWGANQPSGEVAEVVKDGEVSVESHRGNTISKAAEKDDPAVHIARSGNDVVKLASELEVEEPKASGAADGGKAANEAEKDEDEKEEEKAAEEDVQPEKGSKENGNAKAGTKRDHDKTKTNGKQTETKEAADESAEVDDEDEVDEEVEEKKDEPSAKRQKTNNASEKKANGEPGKKGRGRPKKSDSNGTAKGPTKKKEPKKAATESGVPRRSGRNSAQ
ncbi:hypothetical protein EJ08DRAFT_649069 [Tothia fuscella]|uniref:Hypervirulence associated protein TUDOR domain-containing protein n=1 Tax=Tothia fuscella TaxID=1048955 RepID=A0A9P4NTV2_9PEZI|nr:hypothetical protein EJ08DRAFT_649069 [Tothia fuscella]